MAGINDILHIARSGLMVSQTALRTTGQNVTNVNTLGYSRQQVSMQTLGGGSTPGSGVTVANVTRAHDDFLEKQVNQQRGSYQFLAGRQLVADQLDGVFSEVDGDGINTALSDFFNAFKQISLNTSDQASRQNLLSKSQTLVDRIGNAANGLISMKENLNSDIKSLTEEGNRLLSQLAELNRKISTYSDPTGKSEPCDLLDQRDEAVRKLTELVPINTFRDNSGNINVSLANQVVVEGSQAGSLNYVADTLGGVSVTSIAGSTKTITGELTSNEKGSGKLAGLLFERDVNITKVQDQLDALAYSLSNRVNALHVTGFGLDGVSGRNFFTVPTAQAGAAAAIGLSTDIAGYPDRIGAAPSAVTAQGGNSVAVAIADLASNRTTMGSTSFGDYFSNAMSELSGRLNSLASNTEVYSQLASQAEAYRNSVSGVSIDEEMVALIQFQRAFQASAKMVSTVDEMLQTVLSMKS